MELKWKLIHFLKIAHPVENYMTRSIYLIEAYHYIFQCYDTFNGMHVKPNCVSRLLNLQQQIYVCNYQYTQKENVSDSAVKYYEQRQKVVAINDNGNYEESVFQYFPLKFYKPLC
jgi:hypothetical protein